MGTLRLLEAIRFPPVLKRKTRILPSCPPPELYGLVQEIPLKRPRRSTRVSLCGGETIRLLDHRQLPRILRYFTRLSNGIPI